MYKKIGPPPKKRPVDLVPGTGVEPALGIIPTWPSTMRVCQFRHPGWVGEANSSGAWGGVNGAFISARGFGRK